MSPSAFALSVGVALAIEAEKCLSTILGYVADGGYIGLLLPLPLLVGHTWESLRHVLFYRCTRNIGTNWPYLLRGSSPLANSLTISTKK